MKSFPIKTANGRSVIVVQHIASIEVNHYTHNSYVSIYMVDGRKGLISDLNKEEANLHFENISRMIEEEKQ